MEISGIVQYDALHRLDLLHPVTEKPIGISMMIRSAESDASKKVLRKHIDEIYERQQKGKLIKGGDAIRRELEKAASYIESWDWGDNEYDGEIPELSMKKAIHILERENWIFAQVTEAAGNVANFSQTSEIGSAPTSD